MHPHRPVIRPLDLTRKTIPTKLNPSQGGDEVLQGERVTLRAIERDDLPRLAEFWNDLESLALVSTKPPQPTPRAAVEAWFDREVAKEQPESAHFAIEVDGTVIGVCGLFQFDEYARTCRLGIWIAEREHRGVGLGRETVALLLEYAFLHRNRNKVCLDTLGDNHQAIRAFIACGFVEEGRLRQQEWHQGAFNDAVHMGLLCSEWEANRGPLRWANHRP
jgi:RimJ/RimL family protein N-acetyltransferase